METTSISTVQPATSVLFLGSGFSCDATNILGSRLPTGRNLKDALANALGIRSQDYDLKTLADEYASRPTLNLYQYLYRNFTVKMISPSQKAILAQDWLRIYTTNYDDAVEFEYQTTGRKIISFNYDEPKPRKIPLGSIIHLHGVIRRATEESVLDQLILNESSYARQHFEKSPWYDDFVRDMRFSDACYFVGYSLSDYHITALLMQNPVIKERTFFITGSAPDPIFSHRVQPYGVLSNIGVSGFAELCKRAPHAEPPKDPYVLKSFKYLDPFKDKKALSPPTALETLNLISFGTFNYQRCLSTLPAPGYVVPRKAQADSAVAALLKNRCLLVHSRLGNGKTVFLYILAFRLTELGYRCFLCKADSPTLQADIRSLVPLKKVVVFFDSYNSAIDAIDLFAELPTEAKLVVTVRTGVQEVRLHEIHAKLPAPLDRISLNGLDLQDRRDFISLLDSSGIRTDDLEDVVTRCRDLREIVVTLYDNSYIREHIRAELKPLFEDSSCRQAFVATLLLKWIGHEAGPGFLRSVTGKDPYLEMGRHKEEASDILIMDEESIEVRSAVLAEYILNSHVSLEDFVEGVYLLVTEAVKRKKERRYQPILSSLMQVGTLKRGLRGHPGAEGALIELFERLHRDVYVNLEPLFWLQYSILMADIGQIRAAEGFIDTAYARAEASPGFLTFQLDTYALRLWLGAEADGRAGGGVERFVKIANNLGLVFAMIDDDSHRDHAVKVLEGVESFIVNRAGDLTLGEISVMLFELDRLIGAMERLPANVRAATGSDQVKASLVRSKDRLLFERTIRA